MNTQVFPLLLASLAFAPLVAAAQPVSATPPHYTHRELQQLIREAHTPEQYQALAVYFRSQEQMFDEKAAAEAKEWEQRVGGYKVDPARNLYDYYVEKAQEMVRGRRITSGDRDS